MNENEHVRTVFIIMSAIAGSVTALSFLDYRKMTWVEIGMTLFVGFAFAVILVPWIAADWLRVDVSNLRAICASVYLGGTAWNSLMPIIIRRLKQAATTVGGEKA